MAILESIMASVLVVHGFYLSKNVCPSITKKCVGAKGLFGAFVGLFEPIWGSYGIIWVHLGLIRASLDLFEAFLCLIGVIWSYFGDSWSLLWSYLWLLRPLVANLGHFWAHLGLFGPISVPFSQFKASLRPYWPILELFVAFIFRVIWAYFALLEPESMTYWSPCKSLNDKQVRSIT